MRTAHVACVAMFLAACEVHVGPPPAPARPSPPPPDAAFLQLAREAVENDRLKAEAQSRIDAQMAAIAARAEEAARRSALERAAAWQLCQADAADRDQKRAEYAAIDARDAALADEVRKSCSPQRIDVTHEDRDRVVMYGDGTIAFDEVTQSVTRWACPASSPAEVRAYAATRMTRARVKTADEYTLDARDRECRKISAPPPSAHAYVLD